MATECDKDQSEKKILFDKLPDEGKQKVLNFAQACKIYFKNETVAGRVLKVTQGTINRYSAGKLLIPLEVARRFQNFTKGAIKEDAIFFDYKEWLYDQKNGAEKQHKECN